MTIEITSYKPTPGGLTSLHSTLQEAILQYSEDTSESKSRVSLKQIEVTSQRLAQRVVEPRQALIAFHFQPYKVLRVRLVIEMGLFDNLPTRAPFTLQDLSKHAGTGPEFTGRIVRALATLDMFEEAGEGAFRYAALSREWTNKFMQSYTRHSWDSVIKSMSLYVDFFNTTGFMGSSDKMNSPYAFSKGAKDINIFNLLQQDPKAAKTFNEAMTSFRDPLREII
ncbi:hypothetical protein BDV38DRAFT_280645 [Aspergillus pseudotamarii]|uniref:O-methyltransferase dimerisation domain-containing protein n=1 Tax=Aspergillus pseudotamarii TaxID=132259 RepID=A0A5N6T0Q4_ASPPS|nr:uncharacterized protein BDV38DRAFT_280645 [Aspergillus pseudotamarii]KAE8139729.1 hypothetical protein BDV38DRAFT_280645 [Aspergillus pseudotamarii]